MGDAPLWDRLGSIDLSGVPLDRGKAEMPLFKHLAAVGAETDSFAWVEDIEQGFERLHEEVVRGPGRVWEPSSSGNWDRVSVWHPDRVMWRSRTFAYRRDTVGEPTLRAARGTLGRRWRIHRTSRTHRRWRHSYASIPDPVSVHRLAVNAADEDAIVRAGRPDPHRPPGGRLDVRVRERTRLLARGRVVTDLARRSRAFWATDYACPDGEAGPRKGESPSSELTRALSLQRASGAALTPRAALRPHASRPQLRHARVGTAVLEHGHHRVVVRWSHPEPELRFDRELTTSLPAR
jgi:hypothetical protein